MTLAQCIEYINLGIFLHKAIESILFYLILPKNKIWSVLWTEQDHSKNSLEEKSMIEDWY